MGFLIVVIIGVIVGGFFLNKALADRGDLTLWHAIIDTIKPERNYLAKSNAPIWDKPYRAKILHAPDGEKISVSLPCALYGWFALPYLYLIVTLPPVAYFSWMAGYWGRVSRGQWESGWNPTAFLLSVGAVIFVFIVLHYFLLPRIKVTADREGITVGRYKFDWEHSEGLRLGYSAGGKERENKQLGYVGLRMSYGAWGFDLPYMVNGYYSAAYVVWVNMMLETIGKHPDEMTNDPQAGFMKDLF